MASKKKPQLAQSELIEELPEACGSEAAAIEWFERRRFGKVPHCPHEGCGDTDVYQMKDRKTGQRNKDYRWRCRGCGKMFSVRTNSVFADSLIPMHKWAQCLWECGAAKNGISALELCRKLQVQYRTAHFMLTRVRFCMATDDTDPKLDGTIEADLTFVGPRKHRYPAKKKGPNPLKPKQPVFAVVERGGQVRTRVIPNVFTHNVKAALLDNAETSAHLITDDRGFRKIGPAFASHRAVNHSEKEYVNKDDPTLHSNTIESFFSRLKRGLNGVYHHCSREHLHRYVSQYQFLYNCREMSDGERVAALLARTNGKRIMYKQPKEAA
jgi:transposase-like protein